MARRSSAIRVSILGDATDLKRAFGQAEKATASWSQKSRRDLDLLGTWAKRGALAVAGIGVAIAAIALKGGIARALAIEDAQFKLRGLGHDLESVEAIMGSALDSVLGTAYGLDEAATAAANAVAAGIPPGEELTRVLKLTGDTATIMGRSFDEAGGVVNKILASNRVSMKEVNQLHAAGLPILQMLADEYGVTAGAMREMVTQGVVDSATFLNAIENNIGGAALTAGESTRGAFANMRAAMSRFGETLIRDIFPLAKEVFAGIGAGFDTLSQKIKPFLEAFADSQFFADLKRHISEIPTYIEAAVDGLISFWEATAEVRTQVANLVSGGVAVITWAVNVNRSLGGVPVVLGAIALGLKALYAHPVIGGIGLLFTLIGNITKASRDYRAEVDELKRGLEDQTQTVADYAREQAGAVWAVEEHRNHLIGLGLELADVVGYIEGNEAAQQKYNAAMGEGVNPLTTNLHLHREVGTELEKSAKRVKAATEAIDDETRAQIDQMRALGELGPATAAQSRHAGRLRDDTDAVTRATERHTEEVYENAAALREASDPVLNAIRRARDLATAKQNLIDVQADETASSADVAEAMVAVAEATLEAQAAADGIEADNIEAFATAASAALGISNDDALTLLSTLNVLDGKRVKSYVEVTQTLRDGTRSQQSGSRTPGRQMGGDVERSRVYRVGEDDRPELLMIPGDRGRVIPNHELGRISAGLDSRPTAMIGAGPGAITVHITVSSLDPGAAGRAVLEALQTWSRQNGALPLDVRPG